MERYGMVTVLHTFMRGNRRIAECVCDCGVKFNRRLDQIKDKQRAKVSCGCHVLVNAAAMGEANLRIERLIGNRYGALVVVGYEKDTTSGHYNHRLLCKCDCGNDTKVAQSNLTTGNTQSCGCRTKPKETA